MNPVLVCRVDRHTKTGSDGGSALCVCTAISGTVYCFLMNNSFINICFLFFMGANCFIKEKSVAV